MHKSGWVYGGKALPVSVESALADINQVFGGGWPPSVLDDMSLDELVSWQKEAHERHEREYEAYKNQ